MLQDSGTYTVSDFQRHAREHLERIRKSRKPEILTLNGQAALILQDVEAYQELLATVDRAQAIEAIEEGLRSVERGEGRPARMVLDELRRKLNVSGPA